MKSEKLQKNPPTIPDSVQRLRVLPLDGRLELGRSSPIIAYEFNLAANGFIDRRPGLWVERSATRKCIARLSLLLNETRLVP